MCSIINCTGKVIVKREFAGKIAQRPVIASAHINYIYGGIYIMLKIRYMGYNNTHPDGINMEHDQSSYSTISRYKPPFRLACFSSRRYMVILSIKFLYLMIYEQR